MNAKKTPFSSCLADILNGLSITQTAFGQRIGVSSSHLSRYKMGDGPVPGGDVIERIIEGLDEDAEAARLVRAWMLTVAPGVSRRLWVGERTSPVLREGATLEEELAESLRDLPQPDLLALVRLARIMHSRPLVGDAIRATIEAFGGSVGRGEEATEYGADDEDSDSEDNGDGALGVESES